MKSRQRIWNRLASSVSISLSSRFIMGSWFAHCVSTVKSCAIRLSSPTFVLSGYPVTPTIVPRLMAVFQVSNLAGSAASLRLRSTWILLMPLPRSRNTSLPELSLRPTTRPPTRSVTLPLRDSVLASPSYVCTNSASVFVMLKKFLLTAVPRHFALIALSLSNIFSAAGILLLSHVLLH